MIDLHWALLEMSLLIGHFATKIDVTVGFASSNILKSTVESFPLDDGTSRPPMYLCLDLCASLCNNSLALSQFPCPYDNLGEPPLCSANAGFKLIFTGVCYNEVVWPIDYQRVKFGVELGRS
jgi:hypothetical protein